VWRLVEDGRGDLWAYGVSLEVMCLCVGLHPCCYLAMRKESSFLCFLAIRKSTEIVLD
jgi:hypothetical protein